MKKKKMLQVSLQTIVLLGAFLFLFSHNFAQEGDLSLLKERLLEDALVQKGFVPRVSQYMEPSFGMGVA